MYYKLWKMGLSQTGVLRSVWQKTCQIIHFIETLQYCLWIFKEINLENTFFFKSGFSSSQLWVALQLWKIKLMTWNWFKNVATKSGLEFLIENSIFTNPASKYELFLFWNFRTLQLSVELSLKTNFSS